MSLSITTELRFVVTSSKKSARNIVQKMRSALTYLILAYRKLYYITMRYIAFHYLMLPYIPLHHLKPHLILQRYAL